MNGAVGAHTVESGNHGGNAVREECHHDHIGLFRIEGAVLLEEDHLGRIHEAPGEIVCQQTAVEVLAAAGAPVGIAAVGNFLTDLFQFALQIHGQLQIPVNGAVTLAQLIKRTGEILAKAGQTMTLVQKIRDLAVPVKTFAGGGGDHIDAGGIRLENFADPAEMPGVSQ